jgi:hypothetical protein
MTLAWRLPKFTGDLLTWRSGYGKQHHQQVALMTNYPAPPGGNIEVQFSCTAAFVEPTHA